MTEPISGDELADRVEAAHAEIKTCAGSPTASAPTHRTATSYTTSWPR